MRFKEWLKLNENATAPGYRRGLYPPAYSSVFAYPPPALLNWAADAITYLPKEKLFFKVSPKSWLNEKLFSSDKMKLDND